MTAEASTPMRLRLHQAAHWLAAEYSGPDHEVMAVSTDSRRLPTGALFVALTGPHFDGHDFLAAARMQGACAALVSRAVEDPLPQLRVADTRLALGQLAAHWRNRFTGPVIALTGSNGKTTLKEMIAAILRQRGVVLATEGNLNNDIGAPLTVLKLSDSHHYAVIELGANHPGEIAYLTDLVRPTIAVVNNAGPCHLEGFGDLAGVARAKGEIFQGLEPAGVAIINRDDPYAEDWVKLNAVPGRRIVDFGLDQPAAVRGEVRDERTNRLRMTVNGAATVELMLPLPGRHNARNALAATAAALAAGATLEQVQRGLESLRGVGGRMESLPGRHGGVVIHDAYNANPASLAAALDALRPRPQPKWLVLGDMWELGATADALHAQAGQAAHAAGFERLYGLGPHSQAAVTAFGAGAAHFTALEPLLVALERDLAQCQHDAEPALILVKGSRGMRMEQIVEALTTPSAPTVPVSGGTD